MADPLTLLTWPDYLSPLTLEQFQREATVLARLDHPNLPKVSDFFSVDEHAYLVMDYVPGDDLRFLDWNIYARLEKLFLKLFLQEEDLHVSLLLEPFLRDAATLVTTLKTVAPARGALWITGLDGVPRRLDVVSFPLVGQGHRVLGAAAILWDINTK